MLKKNITFTNLDGEQVSKTFYFHLSKVQLARLNFSEKGGLEKAFKKMLDAKDDKNILKTFEDLIAASYGVRHEDGEQFIQSPELSQSFMQTDAYSEFFVELMSSADAAAEFVAGVIPADLRSSVPTLQSEGDRRILDVPVETLHLPEPSHEPAPSGSAFGIPTVTPEPVRDIPTFEQIQAALLDGRIGMLDMKLPQEELTRKIRGTS